jgi:folate-dependent tRNA-U54 methylase TrmFO/GidA
MTNTYTYNPISLQSDQHGIVNQVTFSITATDGTDSVTVNSITGLPAPTSDVIPYGQLTKEQVIEWIQKLVGTQSEALADSELAAHIENKQIVLTNGTPWSA